MFLLDTNILAEPTKVSPDLRILEFIERHAGQLHTASVVWHELQFGVQRLPESRRRVGLAEYLKQLASSDLVVLPYDEAAAGWHASERARLEARGLRPPFADGQIAAIAAVNELVLVTRNVRDFQPFQGVSVVDWTARG
jgi:tRNA(fMet)-specific endonuclease VapC